MTSTEENRDRIQSAVAAYVNSLGSGSDSHAGLAALIDVTSELPLSNLDEWERQIRDWIYLPPTSGPPRSENFPTWVDLCSGDGRKRERTLRALAGPAPNGFFLALAVRRLNDWVPQVRTAAREKLEAIAQASPPAVVSDVLCAVLPHCNSWGRMAEEEKRVLLDVVSIPVVSRELASRLVSIASGPLASVLTQAGQSPALDVYLTDIASNAVQPAVRAKAYRALLDGRMTWLAGRRREWTDIRYCKGKLKPVLGERALSIVAPKEEMLIAAAQDHSAFVRSGVGEVLIREGNESGSLGAELAMSLALDKNRSIAERGKFILRQLAEARGGDDADA